MMTNRRSTNQEQMQSNENPGQINETRRARSRRCCHAILQRLNDNGPASIADIAAVLNLSPSTVGAHIGTLAIVGLIRPVGRALLSECSASSRPVTIWGVHDVSKALEWLEQYPLLDHPGETQLRLPLFTSVAESAEDDATDRPEGPMHE
jgi:predicted transcriptional regulator